VAQARAKAKKVEAKKTPVRDILSKRVTAKQETGLGRDVKMPRWLRAIGRYIKGSWEELRQVRWPTRKVTWGQTVAVIGFTVVLVIFILTIDYGFEQLFKKVIL
jgi:preprotein translocase subunit SecE